MTSPRHLRKLHAAVFADGLQDPEFRAVRESDAVRRDITAKIISEHLNAT